MCGRRASCGTPSGFGPFFRLVDLGRRRCHGDPRLCCVTPLGSIARGAPVLGATCPCDPVAGQLPSCDPVAVKCNSMRFNPERVSQQSLGSPHQRRTPGCPFARPEPRGSTLAMCARFTCARLWCVLWNPVGVRSLFLLFYLGRAVFTATPGFVVRPRWGQSQWCHAVGVNRNDATPAP